MGRSNRLFGAVVVAVVAMLTLGTVAAGTPVLQTTAGLGTQTTFALDGPTPLASCTTITEPGEYVLTQDLVADDSTGACLDIVVDGTVVIDGQGHSVTGGIVVETATEDGTTTFNLSDATVDRIRYPTFGETPEATGRLSNVDVGTIELIDANGLTIESSTVRNDLSGWFAFNVVLRDSVFEGRVQFLENTGPFEVTANEFRDRVVFHEYLRGGYIADNRFHSSLEFLNAGGESWDVRIVENHFTVAGADVAGIEEGAIVFTDGFGIQILNNTITIDGTGGSGTEASNGIFLAGERTTIAGNTITGAGNALYLYGSQNGRIVDNQLVGNDVGIRLEGSNDRIVHNTISDNRVGVEVADIVDPAFEYNDLSGNHEFAVQNTFEPDFGSPDSFDFDARNNYWGANDGPSSGPADDPDAPFIDPMTGTPADGAGGAVSEGFAAGVSDVAFDPFLTAAPTGSGDRDRFYQVDLITGPVIQQFGPADSDRFYSDQGRLIWFLHGSTDTSVKRVGTPPTTAPETSDCVDVEAFSVVGDVVTVQYTLRAGCAVSGVSLVAYEKPGLEWSRATASEQRFVDVGRGVSGNPTDADVTRFVAVTLPTGEYLVSGNDVLFPRRVDPRVV